MIFLLSLLTGGLFLTDSASAYGISHKAYKNTQVKKLAKANSLATPKKTRIIFLHTNDSHGHFYPRKEKGKDVYGALALHAWVHEIRLEAQKMGAKVIVTHGGDLNTGTPESDFLRARPDIELMNLAKFSVGVLGNHEFDVPNKTLALQIKSSKFPWISANVYQKIGKENHKKTRYSPSKKRLLPPWVLFTHEGFRIGILGFTTRSTKEIGNRENTKNIEFTEVKKEGAELIPKLRRKSDLLVALTHLGYYPDEKKQSRKFIGEVGLANEFPSLDLILGGHSHTLVKGEVVNGVPIFQSQCYNRYLTRVDIELTKNQKPKVISSQVISLSQFPPGFDSKRSSQKSFEELKDFRLAEARIASSLRKTEVMFSKVIGHLREPFLHDRKDLYHHSTPLGNLVAYAQRKATGAQLAIVNSGGIRAALPKGKIKVRDALSVSPFGNTLGTVQLTGAQLEALFQDLLSREPSGHFPQVSGARILYNRDVSRTRVYIRGKRVLPKKKYSVALNNFTAGGGNGYPNYIEKGLFRDMGILDSTALIDFLRREKNIRKENYRRPAVRFLRLKK